MLRANDFKFFLPVDIGLFVLGLWQGFFLGSILTGLFGRAYLANRQVDWVSTGLVDTVGWTHHGRSPLPPRSSQTQRNPGMERNTLRRPTRKETLVW